MIEVYLVRHCDSISRGRQGLRENELLSIKGARQSVVLTEKLQDIGISTIFTASLKRARGTATIVSATLWAWGIETDFEISDELNEMNFGDLNDQTWPEIIGITGQPNIREIVRSQQADLRPWNGESSIDVQKRLKEEVEYIKKYRRNQTQKQRNGKLACFTSSKIIRSAYHIWNPTNMPDKIPHGSIHKFEV